MLNFRDQIDERPLALQLQIAYGGDNISAFWRPIEDVLGILLSAGFKPRDAAKLIRIVSNLLAGYLLLVLTVVVGTIVVVQCTVDATIVAATRREHTHWTIRFGADLVQVLLGVALIARRSGTVRAAAVIIGVIAIVAGGVEIATAFSRRREPRRAVVVS
jgi:uncharacterized membrane protein